MTNAVKKHIPLEPDQIAAIKAWAKTKKRVRAVRLFGSRAKRTNRPESDIDLAVTVKPDRHASLATIYTHYVPQWSEHLTKEIGPKVDIRLTNLQRPCPIRRYCRETGNILIYRAR